MELTWSPPPSRHARKIPNASAVRAKTCGPDHTDGRTSCTGPSSGLNCSARTPSNFRRSLGIWIALSAAQGGVKISAISAVGGHQAGREASNSARRSFTAFELAQHRQHQQQVDRRFPIHHLRRAATLLLSAISIARSMAGCAMFLILIQSRERPEW